MKQGDFPLGYLAERGKRKIVRQLDELNLRRRLSDRRVPIGDGDLRTQHQERGNCQKQWNDEPPAEGTIERRTGGALGFLQGIVHSWVVLRFRRFGRLSGDGWEWMIGWASLSSTSALPGMFSFATFGFAANWGGAYLDTRPIDEVTF